MIVPFQLGVRKQSHYKVSELGRKCVCACVCVRVHTCTCIPHVGKLHVRMRMESVYLHEVAVWRVVWECGESLGSLPPLMSRLQ